MDQIIAPAPVRRSVTVNADRLRAFEVFTASIGTWWPRTHTIGASPLSAAYIEPREGGRWYEVGEDGSECQWGDVLAWNPPERLVLAWRIGADWKYDPSLLTEVEVTFSVVEDEITKVSLEHRKLENYGAAAEASRSVFDSEQGWPGILARFEDAVHEATSV